MCGKGFKSTSGNELIVVHWKWYKIIKASGNITFNAFIHSKTHQHLSQITKVIFSLKNIRRLRKKWIESEKTIEILEQSMQWWVMGLFSYNILKSQNNLHGVTHFETNLQPTLKKKSGGGSLTILSLIVYGIK